MPEIIRVAILEDHPAIADGYRFYLQDEADIQLVATIEVGEELPKLLAAQNPIHVLILDVGVPTSHTNSTPYPILYLMPLLLQNNPELNILIISMHKENVLIKALIEAGASGYVFKDDRETLQKFSSVIRMIAGGGIYFSREAHKMMMRPAANAQLLSPRQLEVLSLCAAYPEKTTAELAALLTVADATVRNTLSLLYIRLGVRGRTAALAKARELGLIADMRPAYPLAGTSANADATHP
jgi:DNA-binding NarL/FixJ family response regulator